MADAAERMISPLFRARSIAMLGATERSFWSNIAFGNTVSLGYDGAVHLVNRKGGTIYGRQAATRCSEIGEDVDAALLMVPGDAILDALDDLAQSNVHNAVILSSGFAEAGEHGRMRQQDIARHAAERGINLLGPNCLGFLNFHDRVAIWTSTVPKVTAGPIAIVSQSGATASYIADFAASQRAGLGYLISTGNEVDINVARAVDFVIDDPRIKVVGVFIETVRDAGILLRAAARAKAAGKAIVALKIGKSEMTARVAQAHTGSLVGDDNVFTAVCRQAGIVRVHSLEEMVATAQLISMIDPPARHGLALAAISGGICEIASDQAEEYGVTLPEFATDTIDTLSDIMPEFGTAHNPLDVTGAAVLDQSIFRRSIAAMDRDPGVGLTAVVFDPPAQPEGITYEVLGEIGRAFTEATGPAIVLSTTTRQVTEAMQAVVDDCGTPFLGVGLDLGMKAIANLSAWSSSLEIPALALPPEHQSDSRPTGEYETLRFLSGQGISAVPQTLVTCASEASAFASANRGPLAFKISSPDIQHKSDVGGVILNVEGSEAAHQAFDRILAAVGNAAPDAAIDGVLISPMRQQGVEMFAGIVRDPHWGAVIAVGLGGIWIEALKDTAMRVLPIGRDDAIEMLGELRGKSLLAGYRGSPAVDVDTLADQIVAIGEAALALGPKLASLEVNPLRASSDGCEALYALAIWEDEK